MKLRLSRNLFVPAAAVLVLSLSMARPLVADHVKTADEQLKALAGDLDGAIQLEGAERVSSFMVLFNTLVARSESLIGISVAQVDDVLRSHLGLAEGKGVLVTDVVDGSPAKQAGIQKNDVLVSVGDQEIAGVERLNQLLEAAAEKATAIGVIRSGRRQTVQVTPKSAEVALEIMNDTERRFWVRVGPATADDTLPTHPKNARREGQGVTGGEENNPPPKA